MPGGGPPALQSPPVCPFPAVSAMPPALQSNLLPLQTSKNKIQYNQHRKRYNKLNPLGTGHILNQNCQVDQMKMQKLTDWEQMMGWEPIIVQRRQRYKILLTLMAEAKLWYESLDPVVEDWQGLQDQFRHQYSKFGNTQEQLIHV